jgi:hypothetical protein
MLSRLCRGVRSLAEAGIKHTHPDSTADEVRRELTVRLYGEDVAFRLFGPKAVLEVVEVALAVAHALERIGVDYALGGSVATSLQGEPRSTNDIDFAVRLTAPNVEPFIKALGPDFEVDDEALREAIGKRRSANIVHLPSMTKIDLFIRGAEDLHPPCREALRNRTPPDAEALPLPQRWGRADWSGGLCAEPASKTCSCIAWATARSCSRSTKWVPGSSR